MRRIFAALTIALALSTPVAGQTLREISNRPDPQALNREQIEARERARAAREHDDRDALNTASWVYVSTAAADWSVTAVCAQVLCGTKTQTGLFLYGVEDDRWAIPLGLATDAIVVYGVREFVAPDHPKLARALLYGASGGSAGLHREQGLRPSRAASMMANRCNADRHVWDRDATDPGDTCTCGMWYRWPDRIEYALDVDEDEDSPATEETDE